MKSYLQYVLTFVFGISMFFLNGISENVTSFLCLGLILILGIPHGAVDHKIHQSSNSKSSLARYIITYLLIAAGYIVWWLIDPFKALFIFILLSSYHFGQELLQEHNIKSPDLISTMIWGSMILIAPLLFQFSEASAFIGIVTNMELPELSKTVSIGVPSAILVASLISIAVYYRKSRISKKGVIGLISFLSTIIVIHLLLDFVIAFTLYFVFFHSLNAFKHQYQWLAKQSKSYSVKKFIKDLTSFGVIAIIGIIILLWIINPKDQTSLITLFFVLVSLITLPHAITLDQFYKFRRG